MSAPNSGKIDTYGFERPDDFNYEVYDSFMSRYLSILSRRARRWNNMIKQPNNDVKTWQIIPLKNSRRVKRFIRKGIPNTLRPIVWMSVSGAAARMMQNPGLYKKLWSEAPSLLHEDVKEAIRMDIPRTFPENIYFADTVEGLRPSLARILMAAAVRHKDIAYCQGMNFVASMMLLVVRDEEQTFWLLDAVITDILPPQIYSKSLYGMKREHFVLAQLLKEKCPDVAAQMEKLGLSIELIATKWYMCLFIDTLPIETVLRIWDCLFNEGSKILFRVVLAMANTHRIALCESKQLTDMVIAFRDAGRDPDSFECHQFLEDMFKLPGSLPRQKIEQIRQSYHDDDK